MTIFLCVKCKKTKVNYINDVSIAEAKELILEYLKTHSNVYTSKIAEDLKLSIETVLRAVHSLKKAKKLKVF